MKKTIVFVCVIGILLVVLLSTFVTKVPLPEIKEGRFNFLVTYEVDGEERTCEGVYVCEYAGAYKTLVGRGFKWKGYIENGENEDPIIQVNEDGVIYLDFGFIPEYFMSDPDAICYDIPTPKLYMVYNDDDPDMVCSTMEEDVIAGYGVKLISYEYASPIKNTYKEKLTFCRFEFTIN